MTGKTLLVIAMWRRAVVEICESAEKKNLSHAALKRDLSKGITRNLDDITASWKFETYDRILLSEPGHVNHLKSHDRPPHSLLPPRPYDTTCVICREVLKRHMVVQKDDLP